MKNNCNFGVVAAQQVSHQRTLVRLHEYLLRAPSQNLILFQPDLCLKRGMILSMGNKEDWEEIEKYMENLEKKRKDEYRGIDIGKNLEKINNKKTSNIRKGFVILQVFTKHIVKIIIMIIAIIALIVIFEYGKTMKHQHNIDIINTIESIENIKINVVSKSVDERETTGEYYFELKKFPEIKFKAIKNFGSENNDFDDNLLKYLFENWNNDNKEKFKINENTISNGLLEYGLFYEFNTYEELQEGTELIIDFLEYSEEWNKINKKVVDFSWRQKEGQFVMPVRNMYLKQKNGEKVIYPYYGTYQTANEIREYVDVEYKKLKN